MTDTSVQAYHRLWGGKISPEALRLTRFAQLLGTVATTLVFLSAAIIALRKWNYFEEYLAPIPTDAPLAGFALALLLSFWAFVKMREAALVVCHQYGLPPKLRKHFYRLYPETFDKKLAKAQAKYEKLSEKERTVGFNYEAYKARKAQEQKIITQEETPQELESLISISAQSISSEAEEKNSIEDMHSTQEHTFDFEELSEQELVSKADGISDTEEKEAALAEPNETIDALASLAQDELEELERERYSKDTEPIELQSDQAENKTASLEEASSPKPAELDHNALEAVDDFIARLSSLTFEEEDEAVSEEDQAGEEAARARALIESISKK